MKLTLSKVLAMAALAVCLAAPSATFAQPVQGAASFERYGHIERFDLASSATGRTYRIEIWRPASYATSTRAYPALFLLDGNYSFDAAVALSSYMQRGEIAEHIIVGVSSDVPFGQPLAAVRTPDFTPPTRDGIMTRDVAPPYYRFLKDELIPAVDRSVRVEADQKTLWGYSLSGAFVLWLNYYDASLFRNYIIASPNAEYGIQQRLAEGVVFNAPATAGHKLFFSIDADTEMKGMPDPDGVVRQLFESPMPGYKAAYRVTRGETHSTSWFATLPTALRFIYSPQ